MLVVSLRRAFSLKILHMMLLEEKYWAGTLRQPLALFLKLPKQSEYWWKMPRRLLGQKKRVDKALTSV
jgi:hypothetical protein